PLSAAGHGSLLPLPGPQELLNQAIAARFPPRGCGFKQDQIREDRDLIYTGRHVASFLRDAATAQLGARRRRGGAQRVAGASPRGAKAHDWLANGSSAAATLGRQRYRAGRARRGRSPLVGLPGSRGNAVSALVAASGSGSPDRRAPPP